jgi:hypothetical protein
LTEPVREIPEIPGPVDAALGETVLSKAIR